MEFTFDQHYGANISKIEDLNLVCENLDEESIRKAENLAKAYEERKVALLEYIKKEIIDVYGEIELSELEKALGRPLIDVNREVISYLEHTLDADHIIDVEFSGLLETFHSVSIDG